MPKYCCCSDVYDFTIVIKVTINLYICVTSLTKKMAKSISNKQRIDSSKYVNRDTGELLSSEFTGTVGSVNLLSNDLVKIKSESFVITDTRTLEYLRSILGKSDLGYVNLIIPMVYGNWNMLYRSSGGSPHTSKSLQADLDLAHTAFYGLMQRLYKRGVIYYIIGYVKGRKVKHIMLNPTIARRTNQIQRECLKYFEDLSVKLIG